MNEQEIREEFRKHFKGKTNWMSPEVIRHGESGRYIYEISKGQFMGDDLFGITVLIEERAAFDKIDLTEIFGGCFENMEAVELAVLKMNWSIKQQMQDALDLPDSSFSSHESDLYVLRSDELAEYLKTRPDLNPVKSHSNVEGQDWYGQRFYEFPFQNAAYWERKLGGKNDNS